MVSVLLRKLTSLLPKKKQETSNVGSGASTIKNACMELGDMTNYCQCELPIRMVRNTSESFKFWRCDKCGEKVDPSSKMLDKNIDYITLTEATRNEKLLASKINEILELMRANGSMT